MDLKTELRALGLTEMQVNSKAVEATENILAEKSGVELATLRSIVKDLKSETSDFVKRVNTSTEDLMRIEHEINETKKEVNAYQQEIKSRTINDAKLIDTLNFFTALLSRTQEVFGAEKMTEAVIVQLLETSGYGIWRSIMGSKYDENNTTTSTTKRRY